MGTFVTEWYAHRVPLPVFRQRSSLSEIDPALLLNDALVTDWLERFLQDECMRKRGIDKAVLGLSGGVDSAVVAYLCARAFGASNVTCIRLPYKSSSQESLDHAGLVINMLGVQERTIDISKMVEGYVSAHESDADPTRVGNVCARCRMIVLFDQSAKLRALPIGTGNKTERYFGYFTWHGDDAPPINPLGDLYKTQVWSLARYLGVPIEIIDKPPTADLVNGQTDEGDLGVSYQIADKILLRMIRGWSPAKIIAEGFTPRDVDTVRHRLDSTHWKRHLPTVAMLSDTSVNEYFLRPVDYRGTSLWKPVESK